MKKAVAVIAAVLMLITLFGCGEGKPSEKAPLEHCEITVADVPIENYRIIWAVSPYKAQLSKAKATFADAMDYYTDEYYFYEFYKLIAEDIAASIKEVTGHELPVVSEEEEAVQYEILVGPTNRAESDYVDSLNIKEYEITVTNGKLTVGGGYNSSAYTGQLKTSFYFASTCHAWEYLMQDILSMEEEQVDLGEGLELKGEHELRIISCVGDSITDGAGSIGWSKDGVFDYPSQLQRLLWRDYCVVNHGVTGQTARADLTYGGYGTSYRSTAMYTTALRKAGDYEYMLYMLGTNDSGYDAEWDDADDENYISSSLNIIESLMPNKDTAVPIVVNCVVCLDSVLTTPHGSARMLELQSRLPDKLREAGYENVGFFDMHSYTEGVFDRSILTDGLHPSSKGYSMMAAQLAEYIVSLG